MPKGTAASVAPLKLRLWNSVGSTSGFSARRQCTAKIASRTTAPARLATMAGELQPQSLALTRPSVSAPMPASDQRGAPAVGTRHVVAGNLGQPPQAERQRREAERQVDDEDPAPAEGDQHAADHRTEGRGQAADRGPGADRAAALLGREGGEQQAERGRCHQRRADRLGHAKADQAGHVVRGGAGGRGRGEERHARRKLRSRR